MPSKWGKRNVPDHDTPPKEGKEKKAKSFEGDATSDTDDNDEGELVYCDRCTDQCDQLIQCERCEMWLCSNCEKVPDEVITLIGKFCEFRVHWYCKICEKPAVQAVRSYSHMSNPFREDIVNSMNKIMSESFNKVVENMTRAVNKIEEGVANRCKSLDEQLTSKLTTETTGTSSNDHSPIDTIAAGVVDEQREREKRKLNLILHNVRESSKENGSSRKADDIATVTTMLQNRVGVKATITNAFRLGKRSDRPRLLKVSVSSVEEKSAILKQCYKLKNKENPADVQKIFATPDLTPLEQKKDKALRQKLTELNKNGKVYKIKNGVIVRRV